jgi:hypothetical protein
LSSFSCLSKPFSSCPVLSLSPFWLKETIYYTSCIINYRQGVVCVQFNAKKFSSRKERADGIYIDKAIYVVTKNIDNVKAYKKK